MTQSKEVQVLYQGLQTVPGMLSDIRGGVLALKAFFSAPQAAMSSGSPFMAAAIVALGLELGVFVYETIQAIDDDIDAMVETLKNYQQTDDQSATESQQLQTQVAGLTAPVAPATSGACGSYAATGGSFVGGGGSFGGGGASGSYSSVSNSNVRAY